MSVRASIDYSDTPSAALRRAVAAVRLGVDAGVKHWHDTMLPQHFTVSGQSKYRYTMRQGEDQPMLVNGRRNYKAYYWRKVFIKHTRAPLVWSGESRRAAKEDVTYSTRADGTDTVTATANMQMPAYFYQRPKNSPIDKPDEMTRTTPDEVEEIQGVVERVASAAFDHATGRAQTVRVA